jgi:hypothetical protein
MTVRLRSFGLVVAVLLVAGACGSSGTPKASPKQSSTTRPAVAPNTEDIASLTPMDQSPDQGDATAFKIGRSSSAQVRTTLRPQRARRSPRRTAGSSHPPQPR